LNGNGTGGESNDGQWIACNFLSWMDGAAYSDWAGLRPMTELEYEKACRGTVAPLANEYAWGSSSATAANNITNPGTNNETTNTSGANAVFNNQYYVPAPLRVGVFAKSAATRAQSGASYYGIMELSGNLMEHVVTVGNATGRSFTGMHGNGALSSNGHANEIAWPGLSNGEVTELAGYGFRGGAWNYNYLYLCTSNRYIAAFTLASTGRALNSSFRAVRSVP
jgi:formylglycine-generating enzyme required for sulfatase activity